MHVDRQRLLAHVEKLAARPRPCGSDELIAARTYASECLRESGWTVHRHPFEAVTEDGVRVEGVNLIAEHPDRPLDDGPRFCVGAHLDSRPETPGADDNASAVAALLEIARTLPPALPADCRLTLELVLFDLEELGMLGGAEHARMACSRGTDLRGMVSLEMLGYCDHTPGSQQLPRSLVGIYPDTGNFIAVIGNQNSTALIERFAAGMRNVPQLPVERLQVPENGNLLQATRLSDHSPFWDEGFPALMITDTSFLRNPHYHLASDTPETLDPDFLHNVAQGCAEAVRSILQEGL